MESEGKISGRTRVLGLVGNPVEHSISPQLHNSIRNYTGIDTVYVPFLVEKPSLEMAVNGLKALNVLGFNVTVPYKKEVMKYLDDNTKEALLMGAVNTVKNIGGRLYGYNTDAEGFARSFKEETGTGFKDKRVFVIGAGGAARAITMKIAMEGAKSISIANRSTSRAEELADVINNNIGKIAAAFGIEDHKALEVFADSEIVINTTSVGMYPEIGESPLPDIYTFLQNQIVYDVIYNPPKTRFLSEAAEKGCKTVNGLGMLFYQGVNAYEIWTGAKLPEQYLKELFSYFGGILDSKKHE